MYLSQKFCGNCGNLVVVKFAEGRDRVVCEHCEVIHYTNPKIVVGALATWENKVLLCRRAIEPRRGYWNLPAGYLEDFEKSEDGAIRETWEEAGAHIKIEGVHTVYNLPQANQVYIHFLAHLTDGIIRNGEESIESGLFSEEEIPWDELAFTSSAYALRKFFEDRRSGVRQTHLGAYPER
ncbi:MAG TPA: NUDIX hydrolase [Chitinophagales bacterium]|jgi:ADP-ribose pyrophosphatase YjhB (NUDIX family)|nr:NUDIX hydrolase [Chitinophagales bacterium]HPW87030.1 NUDIX hydrolase [Chitinophagales bacterium]HQD12819.1 NUDIX hydrolase [Chitinophagales bacterium]HQO32858.1 NUDIX hydrolase [Chitinophagales bacterium]HQO88675.1 NUDIX hydrolase [Chitinophagales bacterium]